MEHFYLNDALTGLHPHYATDLRDDDSALINVFFTEENLQGSGFRNRGRLGGQITVSGDNFFTDVFFQTPSEGGNVVGTLLDTNKVFDGIACNDRHMTTKLENSSSFISFRTPPLSDWSSQNTIEFWFKIEDKATYQKDVVLFSMVSNNSNPQLYYQVFI